LWVYSFAMGMSRQLESCVRRKVESQRTHSAHQAPLSPQRLPA
jgi:hypothetical protein